jgi:hypothetical protein
VSVILLATLSLTTEVGGVLLIVRDIQDSRRQAQRILGRVQTVRLGPAITVERAMPITALGGKQPTLDERVARLENAIRDQNARLTEEVDAARREAREAAEDAAGRARASAAEEFAVLEQAMIDQLSGSLGRRLLGVVLIVVAAMAGYAANLVSVLTS